MKPGSVYQKTHYFVMKAMCFGNPEIWSWSWAHSDQLASNHCQATWLIQVSTSSPGKQCQCFVQKTAERIKGAQCQLPWQAPGRTQHPSRALQHGNGRSGSGQQSHRKAMAEGGFYLLSHHPLLTNFSGETSCCQFLFIACNLFPTVNNLVFYRARLISPTRCSAYRGHLEVQFQ